MKKLIFLLALAVTITSCKNESKKEIVKETIETKDGRSVKQSDGLTLLKGEFVYFEDAAVLQTHKEIYGVIINDKVNELNEKAKPFIKEATDFVQVEIRGKITPKPEGEEGWDNRVEIKEILNVAPAKSEKDNVIKLGTK